MRVRRWRHASSERADLKANVFRRVQGLLHTVANEGKTWGGSGRNIIELTQLSGTIANLNVWGAGCDFLELWGFSFIVHP